jgi:hypothetical protein
MDQFDQFCIKWYFYIMMYVNCFLGTKAGKFIYVVWIAPEILYFVTLPFILLLLIDMGYHTILSYFNHDWTWWYEVKSEIRKRGWL